MDTEQFLIWLDESYPDKINTQRQKKFERIKYAGKIELIREIFFKLKGYPKNGKAPKN